MPSSEQIQIQLSVISYSLILHVKLAGIVVCFLVVNIEYVLWCFLCCRDSHRKEVKLQDNNHNINKICDEILILLLTFFYLSS